MYEINIENKRDSVYNVISEGHAYKIDSAEKGMGPLATLLAGLGSCVGVYLNRYLEGAKLPVDSFKINVKADLSSDKPVSFREIKVTVDLKGAKIDEGRREAMTRFVKNCPVHNTLKGNPGIGVEIL
jgi:uncharacterized OsmC-like protein